MKQVIEEKKIIKTSYVTVEPTKKFLSFRHYITLKKKKKKWNFGSKIFILSL